MVYRCFLQYWWSANYVELRSAATKALAITEAADPLGEDSLTIRSVMMMADAMELRFDLDDYNLALSACKRTGNIAAELLILTNGAFSALYSPSSNEEASGAKDVLDASLAKARLLSDRLLIEHALFARSNLWLRIGDLDRSLYDRESASRYPDEAVMIIALEQDKPADARRAIEEIIRFYNTKPDTRVDKASAAIAVAVWTDWTGNHDYIQFARKLCSELSFNVQRKKFRQWRWLVIFAYLGIVVDEIEMTRTAYCEIREMLQAYPQAKYSPGYLVAKIAGASGDIDAAVGTFEDIIDLYRAVGWEYFRCQSLYEYGALLATQNDPQHRSKATSLLEEGLAVARKLALRCSAGRFEKTLNRLKGAEHSSGANGLSPRELEVLSLLALGKTNKEISRDLFISEYTAANHVSHILATLRVNNRSAAVAYAMAHGLASVQA